MHCNFCFKQVTRFSFKIKQVSNSSRYSLEDLEFECRLGHVWGWNRNGPATFICYWIVIYFLSSFAKIACVLGVLIFQVLPRFFLWDNLLIPSSKLFHSWWGKNEVWSNISNKWSKGFNHWVLFLLNCVYFSLEVST